MITKDTIINIITNELSLKPDITSWHNITYENINQFLVTPVKKKFVTAATNDIEDYWIVLDEYPTSENKGYLIVYSEEEESFGIATKQNTQFDNIGTCVSLYDTFIDALNAM